MNSTHSLNRFRLSHLSYLILTALSIWAVLHPLTLFFGVTASVSNIILLVLTGLFGLRKGLLAAFITYSTSYIFSETEFIYVIIDFVEIAFVGFFYRRRFHNMIAVDILYWTLLGSPLFLIQQYIKLGSINSYDLFHLQLETLIGFFGVFIADLIVAYSPFRRATLHFNRLMLHLALTVMLLPFLTHVIYTINNEEQRIITQQYNRFELEALQVEKIMNTLSEADMITLKLNSKLQSKLVGKELQTLLDASSTDIAIVDSTNQLLLATFPIPSDRYEWKEGGDSYLLQDDVNLWLPHGEYTQDDIYRWNQAYMVTEKELAISSGAQTIKLVLLAPFSPYLQNLIQMYQSQFYVLYSISLSVIILSLLYNFIFFRPLRRLALSTTSIPLKIMEGVQIDWSESRMQEISELTDNFRAVSNQLESMFTQAKINNLKLQEQKQRLEESEQQLHKLAYSDSLTGLPNRLSFKHYTEKLLQEYDPFEFGSRKLAMLFLDLDRFKQVNDTYGHDAGDHLLKEISIRLSRSCHDQCRAFRISGDEFVMLIEINQAAEAAALAEALLHSLEQPIPFKHDKLHASCSIGIAIYPDHGVTMDDLLKHADTAMYRAKEHGRNQYHMFNSAE
jgi:diguanylate cyclase (GGDEF)-like protein